MVAVHGLRRSPQEERSGMPEDANGTDTREGLHTRFRRFLGFGLMRATGPLWPVIRSGEPIPARAVLKSARIEERYFYHQHISLNGSFEQRQPPEGEIKLGLPYDGDKYFTRQAYRDVDRARRHSADHDHARVGFLSLSDYGKTDLDSVLSLDEKHGSYPIDMRLPPARRPDDAEPLLADDSSCIVAIGYKPRDASSQIFPVQLEIELRDTDNSDIPSLPGHITESLASNIMRQVEFLPDLSLRVRVHLSLPRKVASRRTGHGQEGLHRLADPHITELAATATGGRQPRLLARRGGAPVGQHPRRGRPRRWHHWRRGRRHWRGGRRRWRAGRRQCRGGSRAAHGGLALHERLIARWLDVVGRGGHRLVSRDFGPPVETAISESPPGAGGLVCLPYLAGERTPAWDPAASGVIAGVTLATRPADLHRAVIDGVALSTRDVLARIAAVAGQPSRWRVGGGGSRHRGWLQATADATGETLEIVDASGGVGPAVLAFRSIGIEVALQPTGAARLNLAQQKGSGASSPSTGPSTWPSPTPCIPSKFSDWSIREPSCHASRPPARRPRPAGRNPSPARARRGRAARGRRSLRVCSTDARKFQIGVNDGSYPFNPGHEWVGHVAEIGPDVAGWEVGDAVFGDTYGGYAEFTLITTGPTDWSCGGLRLDPDLPVERGIFVEPLADCLHALGDQARLTPGERVVVVGAGVMGLQLVALAARAGGRVMVVEPLEHRQQLARELGAELAVTADHWPAAVVEWSGGSGSDVVVVAIGSTTTVRDAMAAAAPGGRIVAFAGFGREPEITIDLNLVHYRELSIVGTESIGAPPNQRRGRYEEALQLLQSGDLKLERLVERRCSLEEVGEVLSGFTGHQAVKTVIDPRRGR